MLKEKYSQKSSEDLHILQKQFNKEKKELETRQNQILDMLSCNRKQVNENNTKLEVIESILDKRKSIEEANSIITEEIKSIDGFELLNINEILVIITKLYKTNCKIKLEKIFTDVIDYKKHFKGWSLLNISTHTNYYITPHNVHYRFEFENEYSDYRCFVIHPKEDLTNML